jgi:PAS domain S-box-containing protein
MNHPAPELQPLEMPAANRILIVDDNETIHGDFRKILMPAADSEAQLRNAESLLFGEKSDAAQARSATAPIYRLDSAMQGQEGLQLVEQAYAEGQPYALVFMDVRMPPGWDGIETVQRIWQKFPELPVVICTAFSDYSWPDMIARLGHSDNLVVLRKPFDAVEVLQLAHALTRKWRLDRQVRAHIQELDEQVRLRTRNLEAANEARRLSEERFAQAFHHNPVPLLLAEVAGGRCVDVNESFLQLTRFKREEVVNQLPDALRLFTNPESEREIREAISARRRLRGRQTELRGKADKTFTALVSAETLELQNCVHFLMSIQDITERVSIESQLRQAQKMEVVGQIAAGVAHDFNNILAVIQGHAELQLGLAHTDESLAESLREISLAANRAASLTRQLLAFSRKQMLRPRALDLREVLGGLSNMLQRVIGENIRLQIQCAPDMPPVLADQINLEQVVINLALNARDAMPEGGPLTISGALKEIDLRHKESQPDAQLGTYVQLTVADQGIGMDPTVRRKIFEPFFTTKAVGRGTGMGLATVYGIVKQHQGWIEVDSAPGVGSTFRVYLPVASGAVTKTTEAGTDFVRAGEGKPRTILIVEDEDALRSMAATVLKRLGHHVLTAPNGAEALKLWPLHRDQVELLFTDMRMPGGVDGRELADRLLQDKPALRIVYSTGYSVDFSNPQSRLARSDNCLLKPYDATALIRAVKKAFVTA